MRAIVALISLLLVGCNDQNEGGRDPQRTKLGLQPGEVHDSGGYSTTNPVATNRPYHTQGPDSGVEGGPIKGP